MLSFSTFVCASQTVHALRILSSFSVFLPKKVNICFGNMNARRWNLNLFKLRVSREIAIKKFSRQLREIQDFIKETGLFY